MVSKDLGPLRVNDLWRFCTEAVHYTLFFEILRHAMPQGLSMLNYASQMVEVHGNLVAILLGVLLGAVRIVRERRQARSRKARRPRDARGRFAKARGRPRNKE